MRDVVVAWAINSAEYAHPTYSTLPALDGFSRDDRNLFFSIVDSMAHKWTTMMTTVYLCGTNWG